MDSWLKEHGFVESIATELPRIARGRRRAAELNSNPPRSHSAYCMPNFFNFLKKHTLSRDRRAILGSATMAAMSKPVEAQGYPTYRSRVRRIHMIAIGAPLTSVTSS
jgi:hypothetical protein